MIQYCIEGKFTFQKDWWRVSAELKNKELIVELLKIWREDSLEKNWEGFEYRLVKITKEVVDEGE